MTVTTTANTSEAKSIGPRSRKPQMRTWLPIAVAGFLLSIVVIPGGRRTKPDLALSPVRWPRGWFLPVPCRAAAATTPLPPLRTNNNGTPPGSYSVTVYAFTESNVSDGSNAKADASVAVPLTVN